MACFKSKFFTEKKTIEEKKVLLKSFWGNQAQEKVIESNKFIMKPFCNNFMIYFNDENKLLCLTHYEFNNFVKIYKHNSEKMFNDIALFTGLIRHDYPDNIKNFIDKIIYDYELNWKCCNCRAVYFFTEKIRDKFRNN